MQLYVDLQIAVKNDNDLPAIELIEKWVTGAIQVGSDAEREEAELTIRIVESDESQSLNSQYRGKDKPTNVLSFPFEGPAGIELPLLGDLVIAKQIVEQETQDQNKTLQAHWARMIIHGTLHLLGYDHIIENEALEMESIETSLLTSLGYPEPYLSEKE